MFCSRTIRSTLSAQHRFRCPGSCSVHSQSPKPNRNRRLQSRCRRTFYSRNRSRNALQTIIVIHIAVIHIVVMHIVAMDIVVMDIVIVTIDGDRERAQDPNRNRNGPRIGRPIPDTVRVVVRHRAAENVRSLPMHRGTREITEMISTEPRTKRTELLIRTNRDSREIDRDRGLFLNQKQSRSPTTNWTINPTA